MNLKSPRVLISLLGLLLLSISLSAQQNTGSINGTVTDASGAAVNQASVKVRNVATNLEQESTTKNDGSFNLIGLERSQRRRFLPDFLLK